MIRPRARNVRARRLLLPRQQHAARFKRVIIELNLVPQSSALSTERRQMPRTRGHGSDPIDDNGHDTHVAGMIGAAGNNGTGCAALRLKSQSKTSIASCHFRISAGSVDCLNADGAAPYSVFRVIPWSREGLRGVHADDRLGRTSRRIC